MIRSAVSYAASISMSENPYLFIVGCPRSGTTLLRRVVDAHREIAITPETQWIPRLFKKFNPDGFVTPKMIDRLLEQRKFPLLGIERDDLQQLLRDNAPVSYANFVGGIFDLYGKAQGKRLVGDKTSGYVRNVHVLHRLWPEAKFVHIVRDGRDVCLSVMNWDNGQRATGFFPTWADDPVSTAALWWTCIVRLGREAGEPLGLRLYHEVRYESLVANTAEECAKLCAFLGVPYDDMMPRFHEQRPATDPGLERNHPWMPITTGLRDWKTEMPAADVERFEAAAGDLLDELGCERLAANPRPEARRYAEEFRRAFGDDARALGWRLPERW